MTFFVMFITLLKVELIVVSLYFLSTSINKINNVNIIHLKKFETYQKYLNINLGLTATSYPTTFVLLATLAQSRHLFDKLPNSNVPPVSLEAYFEYSQSVAMACLYYEAYSKSKSHLS